MNRFVAIYPWMLDKLDDVSFVEAYVFADISNYCNWKHIPLVLSKKTGIVQMSKYLGLGPIELIAAIDRLRDAGYIKLNEDANFYYLTPEEFADDVEKGESTYTFSK